MAESTQRVTALDEYARYRASVEPMLRAAFAETEAREALMRFLNKQYDRHPQPNSRWMSEPLSLAEVQARLPRRPYADQQDYGSAWRP